MNWQIASKPKNSINQKQKKPKLLPNKKEQQIATIPKPQSLINPNQNPLLSVANELLKKAQETQDYTTYNVLLNLISEYIKKVNRLDCLSVDEDELIQKILDVKHYFLIEFTKYPLLFDYRDLLFSYICKLKVEYFDKENGFSTAHQEMIRLRFEFDKIKKFNNSYIIHSQNGDEMNKKSKIKQILDNIVKQITL